MFAREKCDINWICWRTVSVQIVSYLDSSAFIILPVFNFVHRLMCWQYFPCVICMFQTFDAPFPQTCQLGASAPAIVARAGCALSTAVSVFFLLLWWGWNEQQIAFFCRWSSSCQSSWVKVGETALYLIHYSALSSPSWGFRFISQAPNWPIDSRWSFILRAFYSNFIFTPHYFVELVSNGLKMEHEFC